MKNEGKRKEEKKGLGKGEWEKEGKGLGRNPGNMKVENIGKGNEGKGVGKELFSKS